MIETIAIMQWMRFYNQFKLILMFSLLLIKARFFSVQPRLTMWQNPQLQPKLWLIYPKAVSLVQRNCNTKPLSAAHLQPAIIREGLSEMCQCNGPKKKIAFVRKTKKAKKIMIIHDNQRCCEFCSAVLNHNICLKSCLYHNSDIP